MSCRRVRKLAVRCHAAIRCHAVKRPVLAAKRREANPSDRLALDAEGGGDGRSLSPSQYANPHFKASTLRLAFLGASPRLRQAVSRRGNECGVAPNTAWQFR